MCLHWKALISFAFVDAARARASQCRSFHSSTPRYFERLALSRAWPWCVLSAVVGDVAVVDEDGAAALLFNRAVLFVSQIVLEKYCG